MKYVSTKIDEFYARPDTDVPVYRCRPSAEFGRPLEPAKSSNNGFDAIKKKDRVAGARKTESYLDIHQSEESSSTRYPHTRHIPKVVDRALSVRLEPVPIRKFTRTAEGKGDEVRIGYKAPKEESQGYDNETCREDKSLQEGSTSSINPIHWFHMSLEEVLSFMKSSVIYFILIYINMIIMVTISNRPIVFQPFLFPGLKK